MNDPATPGETPDGVTAPLTFLVDTGETPANYPVEAGGVGEARFLGEYEDRPVAIKNARPLMSRFSLDREGFVLLTHTSSVTDLYDHAQIEAVYNAEVVQLVKDATGASRVDVFDHTWRTDSQATREAKGVREPAGNVHNDHTERSAERRLRDELPEEAEELLKRRFVIINVWRPIAEPVQTSPLALCDAASTAPGDLIAAERRAKDRVGEIQLGVFNPNQRWYYFPDMLRNEVLLIKVYDSEEDGRARFSMHSAFENPSAPPGAAPRESIETRTFVFF